MTHSAPNTQGKRAWLIGSGSSLNQTPLHLLKNEVTYTMNRSHIWYPQHDFRPTFWLMVDCNSQNPRGYWRECIEAHRDTPKYLWTGFRDGYPVGSVFANLVREDEAIGEVPNTTWIDRCKHHYYHAPNSKSAHEWHFPELCTGLSGMSTLIQAAVQNGASEIYLLGCDQYGSDYTKNHFTPMYTEDLRDRSEGDNANMNQLHEMAKRCSPVPIYNCTVGGHLEVHPRRSMEAVLAD